MRWIIGILGLAAACHGPYEDGYTHHFEVSDGASAEQRLAELTAEYQHRGSRLAWVSRSVSKRVRWAIEDARAALSESDSERARERLDAAERLLKAH